MSAIKTSVIQAAIAAMKDMERASQFMDASEFGCLQGRLIVACINLEAHLIAALPFDVEITRDEVTA